MHAICQGNLAEQSRCTDYRINLCEVTFGSFLQISRFTLWYKFAHILPPASADCCALPLLLGYYMSLSDAYWPWKIAMNFYGPDYAILEEAQCCSSLALHPGVTNLEGGLLCSRRRSAAKDSDRPGERRKIRAGSYLLSAFIRYFAVLCMAPIDIYHK